MLQGLFEWLYFYNFVYENLKLHSYQMLYGRQQIMYIYILFCKIVWKYHVIYRPYSPALGTMCTFSLKTLCKWLYIKIELTLTPKATNTGPVFYIFGLI